MKNEKEKGPELRDLDPTVKPVAVSKTVTAKRSSDILSGPIHIPSKEDNQHLHQVLSGVGKIIEKQGGNKVLVVCPDPEIIRAFKRMNPQSARFIFECPNATVLRKNPRAELIVLGPFWAHPHFDSIYREIREKTAINPAIRVHWFPF